MEKEILYLLLADQKDPDWHYVGEQVVAPSVPTVTLTASLVLMVVVWRRLLEPISMIVRLRMRRTILTPATGGRILSSFDVNVLTSLSIQEASDAGLQT